MENELVYELPNCERGQASVRYQSPKNYRANLPPPPPAESLKVSVSAASSEYHSTADAAPPPKNESPNVKTSPKYWKLIAVAAAALQVLVIVIVLVTAVKVHQPDSTTSQFQTLTDFPTTCLHLKELGVTESGYHVIQPDINEAPFETYCDMKTSGGGWTLIASVHENDIVGKCTTADKWFSNDAGDRGSVSRNWENRNIFGKADQATSNDYKNSGYYSIEASDVLVRHTPNDVNVSNSRERAVLEYYSDNGFLEDYGGNLYHIYNNSYSLSTTSGYYATNYEEMLDALTANAAYIISEIPDFYHYVYDSSLTSIDLTGGGNNLFSTYGMRIYTYPCGIYHVHGTSRICSSSYSDVQISSRRSTPYFMLMNIGNKQYRRSYYYLRVYSTRVAGADSDYTYTGSFTNGSFNLQYSAYCRNQTNSSIPNLCNVFYAVGNTPIWKSTPFTFNNPSISKLYSGLMETYNFLQQVQGYPQNILLGYTLLSRLNGNAIDQDSVERVVEKILGIISAFSSVAKSCEDADTNLIQPIKYTAGESGVLGEIPSSLRSSVTPGYMQFRARDTNGIAFAFCPAVRVNTCNAQYLCVGGVGPSYSSSSYCSDYAYWNAGSSYNSLDPYNPGSNSHSLHFIETSILIFYR